MKRVLWFMVGFFLIMNVSLVVLLIAQTHR